MSQSAHCRYCNAPILWCETEAYKDKPARKMPCDPERIKIMRDTGQKTADGVPIVRYGEGYIAHFATCPSKPPPRKD